MRRMTVFMGWSALPASMAIQRTPRSFTHCANARVGPADRRPRVTRECRCVKGEVLREVQEFHLAVNFDFSTLPIALRGSLSSTTTRRGHLYAARRSRA